MGPLARLRARLAAFLIAALASAIGAAGASAATIVVVERGAQRVTAIDLDDPSHRTVLATGFGDVLDVATLANGNVLVSDRAGAGRLYEIDPVHGGIVSSEAPGFQPNHLFVEGDGTLLVASNHSGVWRRAPGETGFTRISTVGGDLTGLARIGSDYLLTSAAGVVYRIDPDGALGSNTVSLFTALGEAHALADAGGGAMYLTRWSAGDILRLTGLAPGETPASEVAFAGLPGASGIVTDGSGGYLVTLQQGAGSLVHIRADGTVERPIDGDATFRNPKGIALLGVLKTGELVPDPTAVPEPGACALLGAGCAALLGRARSRR